MTFIYHLCNRIVLNATLKKQIEQLTIKDGALIMAWTRNGAACCELEDGFYVNLGIGLPTGCQLYSRNINVWLSENGIGY
jgi:hypothetical protein